MTSRLWKRDTWPITFTLVVDDFGIKSVGIDKTIHLLNLLKRYYDIDVNWTGLYYIGIILK